METSRTAGRKQPWTPEQRLMAADSKLYLLLMSNHSLEEEEEEEELHL